LVVQGSIRRRSSFASPEFVERQVINGIGNDRAVGGGGLQGLCAKEATKILFLRIFE